MDVKRRWPLLAVAVLAVAAVGLLVVSVMSGGVPRAGMVGDVFGGDPEPSVVPVVDDGYDPVIAKTGSLVVALPAADVQARAVTDAAVARFGEQRVREAAEWAVALEQRTAYDGTVWADPTVPVSDGTLLEFGAFMSEGGKVRWEQTVKDGDAGDLLNLPAAGVEWGFPAMIPGADAWKVGRIRVVKVDGEVGLSIPVTGYHTYQWVEDGEPVFREYGRTVTMTVVPTGNDPSDSAEEPWLLAGWNIDELGVFAVEPPADDETAAPAASG